MAYGRVTIRDVAAACGLSAASVSQILNSKGGYAAATIERVQAKARELGFRKNWHAEAIANGRFGAVALILSCERPLSLLPQELLDGIQDGLDGRGWHLFVARVPDEDLASEDYVPRILERLTCDGLLINYNARVPERMEALIERHRLPAVWLNYQRARDAAHPDDRGLAELATRRLLGLGHRRIAYAIFGVGSEERWWHYSGPEREAGYAQAMSAAGLATRVWRPRRSLGYAERCAYAREQLRAADRPTALVCYSGADAQAVVHAAALEGVAVPRDLSVIGFDAGPADGLGLAVDTALIPFRAVGAAAVDLLAERLSGGRPRPARAVPGTLVDGVTVGPPPA